MQYLGHLISQLFLSVVPLSILSIQVAPRFLVDCENWASCAQGSVLGLSQVGRVFLMHNTVFNKYLVFRLYFC